MMWNYVRVLGGRLVRLTYFRLRLVGTQTFQKQSMPYIYILSMNLHRFVTLIAASILVEGVASNSYIDALPETEYDFTICK